MLKNKKEKQICYVYSTRDPYGNVHCYECPLRKGNSSAYDFRCKANSHYDYNTREWEYD